MAAAFSINNGELLITGPLTFATAGELFRSVTTQPNGGFALVDLQAVEQVDSAGLALLLEWQARARAEGKSLRITNVPDDLLRLAALCEAAGLLGLESRAEPGNPAQPGGPS